MAAGFEMKFLFKAMNRDYAVEMINNWRYEEQYRMYDYVNEREDLLNEYTWGFNRFAAVDEYDKPVGELTVEFFVDLPDNPKHGFYADKTTVLENPCLEYQMWLGFGLRPDLTGKGLGCEFINACIDFSVGFHSYAGEYVRLAVAERNIRAVKTYKRVGFEVFFRHSFVIDGENTLILWMKKKI